MRAKNNPHRSLLYLLQVTGLLLGESRVPHRVPRIQELAACKTYTQLLNLHKGF